MALSSEVSLAIAELVLYLILSPIVPYLIFKHRLVGFLGWFYLSFFVGVRLAAAAIQIAERNKPPSIAGAVVNAIGLTPLILATAGVLHEAAHYLPGRRNKIATLLVQSHIHALAIAGIALGATAGVKLASPPTKSNVYSKDHSLQEAGSILVLLAWGALCPYTSLLFRMSRSNSVANRHAHRPSDILLLACAAALPFIGARTVYGVVYAFDHSPSVSPLFAGFAIQFVLIFLVQFIAALILITAGVLTRNIRYEKDAGQHTRGGEDVVNNQSNVEMMPK